MDGPVDRFDSEARLVLGLAQSEAIRLHQDQIGPEHLLLGLLRSEGLAAQVLASSGVQGAQVLQAVQRSATDRDLRKEITAVALSPAAQRVIALAPEEADQLGAVRIAPEHLLLGILREPGAAGPILKQFGVSLDALREKVIQGYRRS